MASLCSLAWLAVGCEEAREPLGTPACPSWRGEVEALLADGCVSCHGAALAEGNYRLDDYVEALGSGSDSEPNVTARDATSRLLTILDADEAHRVSTRAKGTLDRWVVSCAAQFTESSVHGPGIMDPSSPQFHGAEISATGYDFEACATCHGDDFGGGGSGASCLTCHETGPRDCITCHSDTLALGEHQVHSLGGSFLEKAYDCTVCHIVPAAFEDAGHVFLADGSLDPAPPEVIFSGIASSPIVGAPAATYDPSSGSCSNTYCHAPDVSDANATQLAPLWNGGAAMDCTSCHGQPPEEHPGEACGSCHLSVSTGPDVLVNKTLHLNGSVEFADSSDCGACHGAGDDGAPPPDLSGRDTTDVPSVGLHAVHLTAPGRISDPIGCNECHVVPTEVDAPGHLDSDSPAEVFLGVAGSGPIASARGAEPTYEPGAATCANVYCHGAGDGLGNDTSPTRREVWNWTTPASTGQLVCGSCHGTPPTTEPHYPSMSIASCSACHADTVTTFGQIRFVDGATRHINGVADVVASEDCSLCHGGPANAAPPVDLQGNISTQLRTVGLHQAHLAPTLGLANPVACSDCHIVPDAAFAEGHIDPSPAEVFPTGLDPNALSSARGATPEYDGLTATCSNLYCHGSGTVLSQDTSPERREVWNWTTPASNDQVVCGSCHGLPPTTPGHFPGITIGLCVACHTNTVDGAGNILFADGVTTHMNGVVDEN
ncbi:MAG: CxxxxCH/CxxCH domain-containing protein [Myxococcales bacterium]|nr:CxxxxCH/CxxCH domain-containing protein [Myxococcales bacterium]